MDFYDMENFEEYVLPKYCYSQMFNFRETWAKKEDLRPDILISDLELLVLARKQPLSVQDFTYDLDSPNEDFITSLANSYICSRQ
jgi:ribonuclease D